MATIITGKKHPDGHRFMQDQTVREAMARDETVYVMLNGVYFRPYIDQGALKYEAMPKKPADA
jgi:hypothetical protein